MKEPPLEPSRGFSPKARRERLLVREVADELVVYDLERHRAHSLNRAAALIWRHCDGRTTVAELATLLHRELDAARDETVVWMVLRRLGKAHLLQNRVTVPAHAVSCSRRELMRRMALLGGSPSSHRSWSLRRYRHRAPACPKARCAPPAHSAAPAVAGS